MLQERGQGSNQTCRLLQRQLTWLMKVERVSNLARAVSVLSAIGNAIRVLCLVLVRIANRVLDIRMSYLE